MAALIPKFVFTPDELFSRLCVILNCRFRVKKVQGAGFEGKGEAVRSIDIGKIGRIGHRYRDIDDIRVQRLDLIDPIALIDIYRGPLTARRGI